MVRSLTLAKKMRMKTRALSRKSELYAEGRQVSRRRERTCKKNLLGERKSIIG